MPPLCWDPAAWLGAEERVLQAFHVPALPLLSQQTACAFDLFNEWESNYKAEEITGA